MFVTLNIEIVSNEQLLLSISLVVTYEKLVRDDI